MEEIAGVQKEALVLQGWDSCVWEGPGPSSSPGCTTNAILYEFLPGLAGVRGFPIKLTGRPYSTANGMPAPEEIPFITVTTKDLQKGYRR